MIKKIATSQLQVGMFISNLDASCLEHNFISTRFPVKNTDIVNKVIGTGIKNVYIDTSKGSDIQDAHTEAEVNQQLNQQKHKLGENHNTLEQQVPVKEEIERARGIYKEAHNIMPDLMEEYPPRQAG